MLSFLLIMGIAGGIAFAISSRGVSLWLATLGGIVGLVVGWIGGGLLATYLAGLLLDVDVNSTLLNLMGKGFWWALLAGVLGARSGRAKAKGEEAAAFKLPKWIGLAVAVVCLLGVAMAIALPAYHDYQKRKIDSSAGFEVSSRDQIIKSPPLPLVKPAAQSVPVRPVASQAAPATDATALDTHFRKIYAAHPDADFFATDPEFNRWASSGERKRIADSGTADEVIELLSQYKIYKKSLLSPANAAPQQAQPWRSYQQQVPKTDTSACEYKSVMTDDDYTACGISPPGRG